MALIRNKMVPSIETGRSSKVRAMMFLSPTAVSSLREKPFLIGYSWIWVLNSLAFCQKEF